MVCLYGLVGEDGRYTDEVIQSFCTLEHGLGGFMRVGCRLGRPVIVIYSD